MGQVQSQDESSAANSQPPPPPPPPPPPSLTQQKPHTSSMGSLLAEAVAYGDDENESLDAKLQKALECPCIADLRSGACGSQFSEAFLCFMKSGAEEKGSDCVQPFVALQNCIKANPDAFSKDVLEGDQEEVEKEEKPVQEYKIIPPIWSREPRSSKSKL